MSEELEKLITFGKRLRYVRKKIACVVRQTSFARLMGMTQNKYAKFEKNVIKPTSEIHVPLVKEYYINIVWLFSGEGDIFDFGKLSEKRILEIKAGFKTKAVELNKNVLVNFKYDREEMRKLRTAGMQVKDIAAHFNVSDFTVIKVTKDIVRVLDKDEAIRLAEKGMSAARIGKKLGYSTRYIKVVLAKKIIPIDIKRAKQLRDEGFTYQKIGLEMGYSRDYVSKILNKRYILKPKD